MNEQKEPFGYFRAEPFGWTDCAETDEGAVALYDQETVNALQEQRSAFAELAAFHRDARLGALKELAKVEKQRDELLVALEKAAAVFRAYSELHDSKGATEKAISNMQHAMSCEEAIARVKGGAA